MDALSSVAVYALGLACLGRGIMALDKPEREYSIHGLPSPDPSHQAVTDPPIYMLAVREMSIGLYLLAHQYYGNRAAVACLLAVMAFIKWGDGGVVWLTGGEKGKSKALGHWFTGTVLLAWTLCILLG
ncbi:hypothetical protein FALBO_13336 [Fusarium albosuccineum]|uniref:Uncharacterized protein n=1 Tax=Fusarium albosuccineum TaxID=1237068 RepID=A0A8H4PGG7_9HYPO|nr:hypothetical protein FALBO_13336 [Fusarium albosuccineum]